VGGERFDLIVSNPPYIPHLQIPDLQPEIAYYEPRLALDGGSDGLAVIRRLIADGPQHLRPGGALLCEIGDGQAAAVTALAREAGFAKTAILRDLAGNERTLDATWTAHG
jgi:release factor glutamine methyltransferase